MFDIKERLIYIKSMNSAAHTDTGAETMNSKTLNRHKRQLTCNGPDSWRKLTEQEEYTIRAMVAGGPKRIPCAELLGSLLRKGWIQVWDDTPGLYHLHDACMSNGYYWIFDDRGRMHNFIREQKG